MWTTILWVLSGALFGHLVRYLVPRSLGLTEKGPVFSFPSSEVLGALMGLGGGLILPHGGYPLISGIVLMALLFWISACDLHSKYIPLGPIWVGTALGLLLAGWHSQGILELLNQQRWLGFFGLSHGFGWAGAMILSALGAVFGFSLLELTRRILGNLTQMEVMGMGDSFLLMMIGAYLGPQGALYVLLPACVIGILLGLANQWRTGQPHAPFGPALSLGALVIAFLSPWLISGLGAFYGWVARLSEGGLTVFAGVLILLLFLMLWRLRRKAAHYSKMIEADYAEIDKRIKKTP
jgi:prepilin signal peptidase PulO-like enzyme (type II secretory pathway)/cbb3-type cytochrome oxidase subunit 3